MVVEAAINVPPAEPIDGQCFLITASPDGEWAGKADRIAIWISGGWHYVVPFDGMAIFDRSANSSVFYNSNWAYALLPALPFGGNTIDAEAREAIAGLIQALRIAGVFPNPE
ncbi:DUF2793 domain-containing protein [Erythrobacter sp. WH131]|uniref:DUF2793 domain-containing protein n=2 Tax=Erythrobacter ani TaxID=2827235 RepID=A0ABS6SL77_9SPHN|nr:DUF2793 domain-containing protein [Erythrobacter ani]